MMLSVCDHREHQAVFDELERPPHLYSGVVFDSRARFWNFKGSGTR